jgi:hypothetical protein
MPPRHFWWLAETLDEGKSTKRGGAGLDDETRAQLKRLLEDAQKGKTA